MRRRRKEGKGKGGVTLDTKRLKVVYICNGNTEKSVIYLEDINI